MLVGFTCGFALFALSYQFLYAPTIKQSVLGFQTQGVLPRLQHQLAERLGNEIEAFLDQQDLVGIATDKKVLDKVYAQIESNISDTLENRIAQKSKVLDLLITDRIQKQLSDFVMTELQERLPDIISTYVNQAKDQTNVSEMVASYIKEMNPSIWRELFEEKAGNLKRQISFAGGAFGVLIALLLLASQNLLMLFS